MSHLCPAPGCKESHPTAHGLADHTATCPLYTTEQSRIFTGVRTRRQALYRSAPVGGTSSASAAGSSARGEEDTMDVDNDAQENWEAVKEQIPREVIPPPRPALRRSTRRVPRKVNDIIPPIRSKASAPTTTAPAPRQATPPLTTPASPTAPLPAPPCPSLTKTATNRFGLYKVWRQYPFASPPPQDDGFVSDIPTFTKPDVDETSAWWKGFGRLRDGFLKGMTVDTVCGPFLSSSVFRLVQYYYATISDRSVQGFNHFVWHVLKAKDFHIEDVPDDFNLRRECNRLDEYKEATTTTPFMHSSCWHETTVDFAISCERQKLDSEDQAPRLKVDGVLHRKLIEVIKTAFEGPDSATYQYTPTQTYWKLTNDSRNERVYSEVYNSDAFWQEHERVNDAEMRKPGHPDMPTVVAALMFYSDGTHLTNFGTAALWPFYVFFGNQSKYEHGKPSCYAAHHLAYIPTLPADLQEKYKALFENSQGATAPTITHLKRELMQAIWRMLLQDEEFMEAYRNGIVIKCFDGITHRIFPRLFTYSADYPEKVLLASIRPLARCGCPTCFTEKKSFHELGTKGDEEHRKKAHVDDEAYRERINNAHTQIFREDIGVTGERVEAILESRSEVPVRNAFSEALSRFGFNFYTMFIPDLLHEFEIGVWKAIFAHLIRILHAAPGNLAQILNECYRMVPTYGRATIRRFSNNASAMKKLAAWDFEDLLQCSLPVFEDLLPAPYNTVVLDMLFVLCLWHAYGKLRLHTTSTTSTFVLITRALGMSVRKFRSKVCSQFSTRNLPTEEAAAIRRRQRQKAAKGDTQETTTPKKSRKSKVRDLNLTTFKFHNLGHYIPAIRQFGTTDNFSTQTGEQEHRRLKQFYVHTNKMRAFGRQIARHYRRQRLLKAISVRYNLASMMSAKKRSVRKAQNPPTIPNSEADPLPAGSPEAHYQISQNSNFPLNILAFLNKHDGDPALINFYDDLCSHILARLTLPQQERSDAEFSQDDLARIVFDKGLMYRHKVLRSNYTTYDMQREQDSTNPNSTHTDLMFHSHEDPDPGSGLKPHPYWYGRLCGVYHADITLLNTNGKPELKQKVDFLWVRWFGRITRDEKGNPVQGLEEGRLQRCGFIDTDIEDSGAFGFVDPNDAIRSVHMIPAFAHKWTTEYMGPAIARHEREKDEDWVYYDVNCFSDRDMLMRFCGGGPGHGVPVGEYPLQPNRLYAKKHKSTTSQPSSEDVEMGEVSDAESNADCGDSTAPSGEAVNDEENLALEMEDFEYRDLELVADSDDKDGSEEGEGGDKVDDILNARGDHDVDDDDNLGPEGADDDGLFDGDAAHLGYGEYN
ncbi:hypothetical protein FA13DRAFT_1823627 [Coprinellus micaceus]|uniref:Uncharacterized protein n=1 Tax=Coprinellus micaceus TaxID=71717 RepID=A0A4Y7RV91_COPMI|nr:hypothetical protein FA13DRAFT_1823627 [Coprinellus micaceus]